MTPIRVENISSPLLITAPFNLRSGDNGLDIIYQMLFEEKYFSAKCDKILTENNKSFVADNSNSFIRMGVRLQVRCAYESSWNRRVKRMAAKKQLTIMEEKN